MSTTPRTDAVEEQSHPLDYDSHDQVDRGFKAAWALCRKLERELAAEKNRKGNSE